MTDLIISAFGLLFAYLSWASWMCYRSEIEIKPSQTTKAALTMICAFCGVGLFAIVALVLDLSSDRNSLLTVVTFSLLGASACMGWLSTSQEKDRLTAGFSPKPRGNGDTLTGVTKK